MSTAKHWLSFWFLALAWGSSYFWIKKALIEVGPSEVVALRVTVAGAFLFFLLLTSKDKFPRDLMTLSKLTIMGILSVVVPFSLLTWGNSKIHSSLTGMLNGTVPIFTVILAHVFLPDERINLKKFLGVVLGFAGIFFLMGAGQSSKDGAGLQNSALLGAVAVLAASVCYASGATFARKQLGHVPPLALSTVVMMSSTLILWVWKFLEILIQGGTFHMPVEPLTWFSIGWLGMIGSALCYIIYFHLLRAWDVTKVSFVMYVSPVVAMILGVVFLGEPLTARLFIGASLVLTGIAVANIGSATLRRLGFGSKKATNKALGKAT